MKTSKRALKSMFGALFCGAMMLMPLAACEQEEGTFEEIGEEVDDAVDEATDEVEDAVDEATDAVDEATDEVEDAADG